MQWSGRFALLCLARPSISLEMCPCRCPDTPHNHTAIVAGYFFGLVESKRDILNAFAFIALKLIYRHQ